MSAQSQLETFKTTALSAVSIMEEATVQPLSGTKSPAKSPKRPPLAARVRVAVRVRPPVPTDGNASTPLCITTAGTSSCENLIQFQLEKMQKSFRFDHIFSTDAVQSDVYNEALQPLLTSLLHGFNVTVLAYGQTGSGKTYTMGGADISSFGSNNDDGLIPRFLHDLFDALRNEGSMKTTAKVSFLEIYCDEIRDLLVDGGERPRSSSQNGGRQNLASRLIIHEDDYDVWVEGLQQVEVKNVDEALILLKSGRQRQTIGAHALNDQSSRSHAVYTLDVSRAFANEIKRAKLTFVDLAGSERVKKTLLEGQGMKEGSHINIGLLALGNVINVLGSRQRLLQRPNSAGGNGRRDNIPENNDISPLAPAHVPYRSSKLTRLLRDALGGNSVTLFIACISPEITNGNETLCTLQYANRARSIQNKAQKNIEEAATEDKPEDDASIVLGMESQREIYALREQVAALKLQLDQAVAAARAAEACNSSLVAQCEPNSSSGNVVTLTRRKSTRTKRRLRIAPLELEISDPSNIREMSRSLESVQRQGIVNKSTGQLKNFFQINTKTANTTNQATPVEQEPQTPEFFTHRKPSLVQTQQPNAEIFVWNEDTAAHLLSTEQVRPITNKAILKGGKGSSEPILKRVMINQSTQYEAPCPQDERKTPVDYVLLSPSQIFREVHSQKQKTLAGAPSPWPHRRRLDALHNEPRFPSTAFGAFDTNNSNNSPYLKTRNVLQDILQRTRQLVENRPDLDSKAEFDDPEQKEEQQNPLSFNKFVDRMTELYDKRIRQHHVVRRLTQRFRHLASLLGVPDIDSQMSELSKYTLENQQDALEQHLETFESLAADRLWTRLQHREVAIENYAEAWNEKLTEAFISDDQYETCMPWHARREDHEFFQHHILPFILNGWISVTPSDLDNEQLWLTL